MRAYPLTTGYCGLPCMLSERSGKIEVFFWRGFYYLTDRMKRISQPEKYVRAQIHLEQYSDLPKNYGLCPLPDGAVLFLQDENKLLTLYYRDRESFDGLVRFERPLKGYLSAELIDAGYFMHVRYDKLMIVRDKNSFYSLFGYNKTELRLEKLIENAGQLELVPQSETVGHVVVRTREADARFYYHFNHFDYRKFSLPGRLSLEYIADADPVSLTGILKNSRGFLTFGKIAHLFGFKELCTQRFGDLKPVKAVSAAPEPLSFYAASEDFENYALFSYNGRQFRQFSAYHAGLKPHNFQDSEIDISHPQFLIVRHIKTKSEIRIRKKPECETDLLPEETLPESISEIINYFPESDFPAY